jgi:hypothetical protein
MLLDVIDELSGDLYTYFVMRELSGRTHNVMSMFRKLIIWGKIFIHKHTHQIMNFGFPPESSLIKKYVKQTTRQCIDVINQHCHNA